MEVSHYQDDLVHRLGYQVVEDGLRYDQVIHSAAVDTPTLIIHGTDDEVCSFEASAEWTQSRPGVRFHPIPGGDHGLLAHLDPIWEVAQGFLLEA